MRIEATCRILQDQDFVALPAESQSDSKLSHLLLAEAPHRIVALGGAAHVYDPRLPSFSLFIVLSPFPKSSDRQVGHQSLRLLDGPGHPDLRLLIR
jgi:hypothetical protein